MKRCDFHNEWTLRDGFQTLSKSRKPLWHSDHSRPTTLTRAPKWSEFGAPTSAPRGLEKKRDGFQTLPYDASPPLTSTN